MGTRASRLQEDPVPSTLGKDGTARRESYRRPRCARPTSLMVDFSGSFEDTEVNRSRSEEGSDSDLGQHGASADGSPADHHGIAASMSQASPTDDNHIESKAEEDGSTSPEAPVNAEHQPGEETGRTPHRTFSERLPGNRHAGGRSVGARSARVRGTHQRPVSEAWIGLYRVNNRHGNIRCPFCSKPFPGGRIEDHLLSCLTSPPLPYNTDVLSKDSGECSICLEDLVRGETIARLACLCVYHKSCIDAWAKVKPCCPEHPSD
ncbi:E3 ubiquitin-protein ligase znrf2 isoform X1 [Corythoichthys intestinalis]|uniref:E3 ubiquitin-protein ligase znrf2 isoform X1 n=1 Tax=Corythoichthys intestinalis TaxID=161448 RepID=UPI0025A642EF|nr:E3 ubiquitin-protein ligase znrf2 isoform X1 [Corythoichthys intestinalis]XP_061795081.1 E3 ubiquitin-protein ligase znrf2-like [Nerophis lumbriciformis]